MKKSLNFLVLILLISGCQSQNVSSTNKYSSSFVSSFSESRISSEKESSSSSTSSNVVSSFTSTSTSSSSSSSSSLALNGKMLVSEFMEKLLGELMSNEVLNSYHVTSSYENTAGSVSTRKEESMYMFNDGSSKASGEVYEIENNIYKNVDTYEMRRCQVVDKIEYEGVVNEYPMYVEVIDYADDSIIKNGYHDLVTKKYILEDENAAKESGLARDLYILENEYLAYAAKNTSYEIALDLDYAFLNNAYASQLGISYIDYSLLDDCYYFTLNYSYSYNGDLNDVIKVTDEFTFTLNTEMNLLLGCSYSSIFEDSSKSDPTDVYTTITRKNFTIIYDSREEPYDVLDVDDYFLAEVNDVDILMLDKFSNRVSADPTNFPLESSYMFAKAKDYLPLKAYNTALTCVNSSNESVVKLDNAGYMEVKGAGTTTLTFSYFGKENGIYREKTIQKSVTVVTPAPKEIRFDYNLEVSNNTLEKGKEYVYRILIIPSQANQNYVVSSSNDEVIQASINENNDVVLRALKAGSASIRVTSSVDSKVTASLDLTVAGDNNYEDILINSKYVYSSSLSGYTFEMYFTSSSEGYRLQITKEGKSYRDEFTYHLDGLKIVFDSWNDDVPSVYRFDYGNISNEGNTIICEVEETYGSFKFNKES